jgi:hypothetical protein
VGAKVRLLTEYVQALRPYGVCLARGFPPGLFSVATGRVLGARCDLTKALPTVTWFLRQSCQALPP